MDQNTCKHYFWSSMTAHQIISFLQGLTLFHADVDVIFPLVVVHENINKFNNNYYVVG